MNYKWFRGLAVMTLAVFYMNTIQAHDTKVDNKSQKKAVHFSYYKLVEEKLYLIIENKSEKEIKVSAVGGYVTKTSIDVYDGERVMGRTSPHIKSTRVHTIKANGSIKIEVFAFKFPKENEKTVVHLRYDHGQQEYATRFEVSGKKFEVEEKLMKIQNEGK